MTFIRTELGGPVASVVLDHAGGNRINFDMRVELDDAFAQVATRRHASRHRASWT